VQDGDQLTLRSVAWDGNAPAAGDLVHHPDHGHLVVELVAAGAGVGHWTLQCRVPRVIGWTPASWQP
jgi:hypothetical protein